MYKLTNRPLGLRVPNLTTKIFTTLQIFAEFSTLRFSSIFAEFSTLRVIFNGITSILYAFKQNFVIFDHFQTILPIFQRYTQFSTQSYIFFAFKQKFVIFDHFPTIHFPTIHFPTIYFPTIHFHHIY